MEQAGTIDAFRHFEAYKYKVRGQFTTTSGQQRVCGEKFLVFTTRQNTCSRQTCMLSGPTSSSSVLIDTRIYPIAAILKLPPVRSSRDLRTVLITGE